MLLGYTYSSKLRKLQVNYTIQTPIKLAIFDQKRAKNGPEYPKFPYFSYGSCKQMYEDPFGKVICKTLEFRPSEYQY